MAGLVVFAGLSGASALTLSRRGPLPVPGDRDSYYVVSHIHYVVLAALAFAAFAGIYRVLEASRRGRRRRLLGAIHFAASFLGVNLMLFPQHLLVLAPGAFGAPSLDGFALLNAISASGYVLTLAGQAFFVLALLDALRREPDLG